MALGLTHALDAALDPLRRTGRRSNYWLLDNTHEVYATQQLQNIITRFIVARPRPTGRASPSLCRSDPCPISRGTGSS